MTIRIFWQVNSNETIDDLTVADRLRMDDNKVNDIQANVATKSLVITYQDWTTQSLDLDTITTDVNVSWATLNATSNILTLTADDGWADVTVNLSDFVNSSELTTALQNNKPTGYSFTNDSLLKSFDANTVSLSQLADVVATYIKDRQS